MGGGEVLRYSSEVLKLADGCVDSELTRRHKIRWAFRKHQPTLPRQQNHTTRWGRGSQYWTVRDSKVRVEGMSRGGGSSGETAKRRERTLLSKTEGGHREGAAGNKRGESRGLQESRVTGQRRQLSVSEVKKWAQPGELCIGTRVGGEPPRDRFLLRKRSP